MICEFIIKSDLEDIYPSWFHTLGEMPFESNDKNNNASTTRINGPLAFPCPNSFMNGLFSSYTWHTVCKLWSPFCQPAIVGQVSRTMAWMMPRNLRSIITLPGTIIVHIISYRDECVFPCIGWQVKEMLCISTWFSKRSFWNLGTEPSSKESFSAYIHSRLSQDFRNDRLSRIMLKLIGPTAWTRDQCIRVRVMFSLWIYSKQFYTHWNLWYYWDIIEIALTISSQACLAYWLKTTKGWEFTCTTKAFRSPRMDGGGYKKTDFSCTMCFLSMPLQPKKQQLSMVIAPNCSASDSGCRDDVLLCHFKKARLFWKKRWLRINSSEWTSSLGREDSPSC
jgi:hypothetical protein